MTINLDYLQFYSFKVNSNFNNYVKINFAWDKLWNNLSTKLKHVENIKKFCKSSTGSKDHHCNRNDIDILLNTIIKDCYPKLYNSLEQILEIVEKDDICYFFCQIHSSQNSKDVIFCYIDKKKSILYPLIFDLNHCICKVSEKKPHKYRYDKKTQKKWHHVDKEAEIKNIILKK